MRGLLRACAAEAIGVFLLVFAGPGAVVVDSVSGGASARWASASRSGWR